jgi:hypothetical protein
MGWRLRAAIRHVWEAVVRVTMAEAGGGSRPGGLPRRQVVLLAERAGLAAVLGHLLGPADRLCRLGSLRELAQSRLLEGADVVVLDLPDEDRAAAVGQVRRRYRGPLVVLAGDGETPGRADLDEACLLLARPFSVEGLAAALFGQARPPARAVGAAPVPPPAADTGPVPAPAARRHPIAALADPPGRRKLVDRGQRLLVAVVEGWQTRRQVRVAGFAVLAGLAFTVAFVLAVQGSCGPGCDQLRTGVAPAPTITSPVSRAASTTRPRHPTSTTTIRIGSPGTGAFLGTSDRRRATATSERGTTILEPTTTRPATTQSATTQSTVPSSTAPTTTQPATTPSTTASG